MSYYIKHKGTQKFFAGFDSDDKPAWTSDQSKAWVNSKVAAECQAGFLSMQDRQVQKKPVSA